MGQSQTSFHRLTIALPCALIRLYQGISHWGTRRCRFEPTCSEYMRQSLQAAGLRRGGWAGLRRLAKCHPWHPGGWDPIPFNL